MSVHVKESAVPPKAWNGAQQPDDSILYIQNQKYLQGIQEPPCVAPSDSRGMAYNGTGAGAAPAFTKMHAAAGYCVYAHLALSAVPISHTLRHQIPLSSDGLRFANSAYTL